MKTYTFLTKLFTIFTFLLFFAVSGWGESPDAADSCSGSGATSISYSSSITIIGESPNNDADYYKITVPADKTLSISTSSPNNHDYHLSIGSTCDGEQYYSDTTAQSHSIGNIVLTSGSTVYFYIKETGNDTDQYQLNLTFVDYVPDPNAANFHEGSRPFTIRNPVNTRNIFGNYFVGGNTNMCVTDATNNFNGACTNIATYKNNSYYTKYIDVDGDSSTFNSSTFTLNIPSGSKVVWAGLYWQGYIHNSDTNNDFRENMTLSGQTVSGSGKGLKLSVNSLDAEKVLFKTPQDAAYQTVTAGQVDFDFLGYAGFKDVTSLLDPLNANGIYTVANIQSHEARESNHGNFAGWSLVVVYENSNEDLNNVSVFDGYATVDSSYGGDITVSGFYTPTSGTVNSKVTVFSMEGESDTGDSLKLDGALLPVTGLNADTGTQNNVFNGSITNVPVRNPIMTNNDGLDLDTFNTSSIVTNGQSSATLSMRTTGDRYTPSMLVFSTQLYQPEVCYYEEVYKGATKLENGAQVNKGDMLNVKVYVTNKADETAEKVKVYRTFDSLLPYIESSTRLDNNNPTYGGIYTMTAQTDNIDADTFDYNTTDKKFQIRIGTGATSVSGGNIIKNHGAAFDYNITMNSDSNTSISYEVAYTNTAINFDYIGQIGKCVDFNNTFWGYYESSTGNFSAIHAFHNLSSYNNGDNIGSAFDPLNTKVASKVDDYKIISYDGATNVLKNLSTTVAVELVDADNGGDCSTYTPVTSKVWIPFHDSFQSSFAANDIINGVALYDPDAAIDFYKHAGKNLRFRISYPRDNSGGVVVMNPEGTTPETYHLANFPSYAGSTCVTPFTGNKYHPNGTLNGDFYYTQVPTACANAGAANASAMIQGEVNVCLECIYGGNVSYSCSRDNFSIRPASYTSTFSPNGTLKAGEDFNVTTVANGDSNLVLTGYDGDAIIAPLTQTISCPVRDGNLSNTNMVFDGVDTNVSTALSFRDIGVFDVNITDSTWTGVDSAKNECVVDSDSNIVDINNKIGCLTRISLVKTVIPHHFGVISTVANHGNGFSYISADDLNTSNIAATLNIGVTAQTADTNLTTQNYNSACYANPTDYNISYSPLTITPSDSLSTLRYFETNTSVSGANDINTTITINNLPNTVFSTDTNGTANLVIKINFDRNASLPVNPFIFDVIDTNVSDIDLVTGSDIVDINATFVYGRTHASKQRYIGNAGNANIYFESFCFGVGCSKTLLPNALVSTNTDDIRWFINANHVVPADGNVTINGTVVRQINSQTLVTVPNLTIANPSVATIQYNGNRGYPYKTTMENVASPWLIYNENNPAATTNEFQVEFNSGANWSGAHDTNTTTTTDKAIRTNRRIMW